MAEARVNTGDQDVISPESSARFFRQITKKRIMKQTQTRILWTLSKKALQMNLEQKWVTKLRVQLLLTDFYGNELYRLKRNTVLVKIA